MTCVFLFYLCILAFSGGGGGGGGLAKHPYPNQDSNSDPTVRESGTLNLTTWVAQI